MQLQVVVRRVALQPPSHWVAAPVTYMVALLFLPGGTSSKRRRVAAWSEYPSLGSPSLARFSPRGHPPLQKPTCWLRAAPPVVRVDPMLQSLARSGRPAGSERGALAAWMPKRGHSTLHSVRSGACRFHILLTDRHLKWGARLGGCNLLCVSSSLQPHVPEWPGTAGSTR